MRPVINYETTCLEVLYTNSPAHNTVVARQVAFPDVLEFSTFKNRKGKAERNIYSVWTFLHVSSL